MISVSINVIYKRVILSFYRMWNSSWVKYIWVIVYGRFKLPFCTIEIIILLRFIIQKYIFTNQYQKGLYDPVTEGVIWATFKTKFITIRILLDLSNRCKTKTLPALLFNVLNKVKVLHSCADKMGRIYRRKSSRRSWTEEQLSQAVSAVQAGMAKREASRVFQIPRRTLERYIQKAEETGSVVVEPMGGFKTVFSSSQEEQLVNYLVYMSQTGFGLSPQDVRSLAYQMAVASDITNPFDQTTELAETDWL